MLKNKYLYFMKWLIKPKPYPALSFSKASYTLHKNVIVGCVVAVVVVGCADFNFSELFKPLLNSKAVFLFSVNVFFSIILILVEIFSVNDCISKILREEFFSMSVMTSCDITW